MKSNGKIKKIDIKNRACYYFDFDDIIKNIDISFKWYFITPKIIWKYFSLWRFMQNFNGSKTIAY